MGDTEVTIRAATQSERVVQNSDGTFSRTTIAPAASGPALSSSKTTVEVGGNTLARAAAERVARMTSHKAPAKEAAPVAAPQPKEAPPVVPVAAAPETPKPAAEVPSATPAPSAVAQPPPAAPVAAPAPVADDAAELRTTIDRQAKLLEQATGEIERLSKGQTDEIRARVESLRAAEDGYLDNPYQSVRRYVANSLGVKEDDAAAIDEEIDALTRDLIAARHPGTYQLDEATKANRNAALLKRSLTRDRQRGEASKRETETQEQRRQADLADRSDQQIIARHLESNKQSHPHLMALAGPLDGSTPEAKVLEAIKTGIAVGHFDPKTPPERLLTMGAELAEKHYRARLDAIQKARPNTDTAAPSPPPVQPAGAADANVKDGTARQSHGSRTITNADASVAPAGAVETVTKTDTKPKSRDEHLRDVMQKHGIKTRR